MSRFLVKPTRFDDAWGREQKVYLIFDLDHPEFDESMRLKPKKVSKTIPRGLRNFLLTPTQVITSVEAREYLKAS
jgi:hypothetical protein